MKRYSRQFANAREIAALDDARRLFDDLGTAGVQDDRKVKR